MPCFKGLAVSIHTPDGPLTEYSIQKHNKHGRITAYIPVPPAKVPEGSLTNKPEQSTFAISITLLTPGLAVPYSAPKLPDGSDGKPRLVGPMPDQSRYARVERDYPAGAVIPYIPLTASPNETIAAYIYFDGRAKEEVATLLRRGEETWVNSRWVSVPESEGGGLAEREFLFREVSLDRWLNGLDLEGKNDAAKRIERRRARLERKNRRRKDDGSMEEDGMNGGEDDLDLDESDSDSEPPVPEAAGQIKVALFRVLASGEIKRGEYSPQFDAHDDDDEISDNNGESSKGDGDLSHTAAFAKPKTLDPKTISTQTVTGIDGPDKPYAVFTFLYRGERQLRKMNILPTEATASGSSSSATRKSLQDELKKLGPLRKEGTLGFATFREGGSTSPTKKAKKAAKRKGSDDESSDDEVVDTPDEPPAKDPNSLNLSPEEVKKQEEVAEGVRKIRLKRQHSFEPAVSPPTYTQGTNPGTSSAGATQAQSPLSSAASPAAMGTITGGTVPPQVSKPLTPPTAPNSAFPASTSSITAETPPPLIAPFTTPSGLNFDASVGSPLKRHRASMPGLDESANELRRRFGFGAGAGGVAGASASSPNTSTSGLGVSIEDKISEGHPSLGSAIQDSSKGGVAEVWNPGMFGGPIGGLTGNTGPTTKSEEDSNTGGGVKVKTEDKTGDSMEEEEL